MNENFKNKNRFVVGFSSEEKQFDCPVCAMNFYNSLGDCKKYLRDVKTKSLIANTYEWTNTSKVVVNSEEYSWEDDKSLENSLI